jgi:putative ABC transport system permease protein
MTWLRVFIHRLRGLFLKRELEQEVEDEIRSHLELQFEDNLRLGMNPEEARRQAQIKFGGVTQTQERYREQRGLPMLETFLQDLRFGARMLKKNPGFTFIAVLTLGLGIGANTAIFSMVYALLLRPLPYAEAERLVQLAEKSRAGGRLDVSYPNFDDWRARAQSFEGMASVRNQSFSLTGVDQPVQLRGRTVSWNFFQLLGVQPQLGRVFVDADDKYGATRTVLLSHGMWQDRFGGAADVLGKKLLLDGEPYEVIGVLPPGFEYFRADDLYVPIGLFLRPEASLAGRGNRMGLSVVARLKPGVTLAQANAEMTGIAAQLEREYPAANSRRSAQAEALQDVMSESVRQTLWVLLGAVGFILLMACVNVANLLLVRAAERQKEIAVRLALGAGRVRIFRQLLNESLLIALLGGVAGLLLGQWMLKGLLALAPDNIPQLSRVGLNGFVLLFTLGVALLTSVLSGLLPALHTTRADLQTVLKEGGRSNAGAAREGTRKALLVVEVSLALVLLVGAGLLVRSMYKLLHVDPGFNPDNLLTMFVSLPRGNYNAQRLRVFYDESLARVDALPDVLSAALTLSTPIAGSQWNTFIHAAEKPEPPAGQYPEAAYTPVSANYFETLGIRVVKGRVFTTKDTEHSAPVTVINESLARRIWPGEDPLGKRLKRGMISHEVVGVVADVKLNGVEQATPMQFYAPLAQEPMGGLGLIVRTAGDPLATAASIERAIHSVDKDLPVYRVRTMDQLLGNALAQRRLTLTLLLSFAVLALLLASIGIYGVISYTVKQRTHELGLRLALGAQPRDVLKLILTQGLRSTLLGIMIGLGASFALTRWMEKLLFGVRPTDPLTFGVIALVLLSVALLACWIPARRATKVNPLIALRNE